METHNSTHPGVTEAVDHLFRREAGRMVATLTRYLGTGNLHLAEDVVQDAMAKAMQTWPFTGIPSNPSAWIIQTARNRAIDQMRRSHIWTDRLQLLTPYIQECLARASATPAALFEEEIRDGRLRMMFACCHPDLPPEVQLALTLKTLCGFGEAEIAAAFLTTPGAIAKRLVRGRQTLREKGISMELPSTSELVSRLDLVLQVLYLLFNEGYKSSHGDALVDEDLCAEAINLAESLVHHPVGRQPKTQALLALMYFGAARLPARLDAHGNILLLEDQDRSFWDRSKIGTGLCCLEASGAGDELSRFHFEAGIAAQHCLAPSFATTNWRQILSLYDSLAEMDDSPVVALNRAVAFSKVYGAKAGLDTLTSIAHRPAFVSYYRYPAVVGHLWQEAGDFTKAATYYRRALDLATVPAERAFFEKRLAHLKTM